MPYSLPVRGGAPVAVGKIVAVAKNYEDHRKEMAGAMGSGAAGDQRPPSDPVLFLKPSTCMVGDGGSIVLAPGVSNVHWETELGVLVGQRLSGAVSESEALRAIAGYCVHLDMTARDLQAEAKKQGTPWTLAKGMDTFGPTSEVVPVARCPSWDKIELRLDVNGERKQSGRAGDMIHPVPKLLAYIARYITLEPGDLVVTGTPAGVGPCKPGDKLHASLPGLVELRVDVRQG